MAPGRNAGTLELGDLGGFPRSSFVVRRGTPFGWWWRKWRKNDAFVEISTSLHLQQGILGLHLWYMPIEILGKNRVCHSSYGIIPAISV
jgi:hypothetical protein